MPHDVMQPGSAAAAASPASSSTAAVVIPCRRHLGALGAQMSLLCRAKVALLCCMLYFCVRTSTAAVGEAHCFLLSADFHKFTYTCTYTHTNTKSSHMLHTQMRATPLGAGAAVAHAHPLPAAMSSGTRIPMVPIPGRSITVARRRSKQRWWQQRQWHCCICRQRCR